MDPSVLKPTLAPSLPRRLNPLSPRQKYLGLSLLLVLLTSGGTWLTVHFLHWPLSSQAPIEGLPSPWESSLMRLHGAAAMGALIWLGSLLSTHVIRGWSMRKRRQSGVWLLALASLLVLSAYLLYYWVPEALRDTVGLLHGLVGLTAAGSIWVHRRRASPRS